MKQSATWLFSQKSEVRNAALKFWLVFSVVIFGLLGSAVLFAAEKPAAYAAWKPKLEAETVIDVLGSTLIAESTEDGSYRIHTRSGEVVGPFDVIETYELEGTDVRVDARSYSEGYYFYRVDSAGKVSDVSEEMLYSGEDEYQEITDGDGNEEIVETNLSPDPKQEPVVVSRMDEQYFVRQGAKQQGPFKYYSEESLMFSSNGKTFGFIYGTEGKDVLCYDGKDVKVPGSVISWYPAPDGSAPWAWVRGESGIVLFHGDKSYSQGWEDIFPNYPLVFDPTGKIPAYCAYDGENCWVMAGQKKIVSYQSGSPKLAWPKGYDTPWYAVRLGSTWTLVAGKKKYEASFSDDSIGWFIPRPGNLAPLWVSNDRTTDASTFHEGDTALVVSNNTEGISLSSDGKRYALIVMGGHTGMDAVIYGNRFVMVSNKPGTTLEKYGSFSMAGDIEMSPDGKIVSFTHGDGVTKYHTVIISSKLYPGRPETNGAVVFDGDKVVRIVP